MTVIQGDADLQITLADARALANARRRTRLVLVPGMTHVLKDAPGAARDEQLRTVYADPALPIDPLLVKTVLEAVR